MFVCLFLQIALPRIFFRDGPINFRNTLLLLKKYMIFPKKWPVKKVILHCCPQEIFFYSNGKHVIKEGQVRDFDTTLGCLRMGIAHI